MRFASVRAIDRVTPIHQPGTRQEHMGRWLVREALQERRYHSGRLRSEQRVLAHVASVTSVARSAVSRIMQAIVVIRDGHDGARAVHERAALPGAGERA